MDNIGYQHEGGNRFRRIGRSVWGYSVALFERAIDGLEVDIKIMRHESDAFLGAFLFLMGVLNFHSGRYCDGNTADYLSCTRPVTYYYFTWLEIACIVIGVFFIMLWFMKRGRR